jgi:hypothetical protein
MVRQITSEDVAVGIELHNTSDLPEWFKYPARLQSVVNEGLVDFHPWHMLSQDAAIRWFAGLRKRFPDVELFPFAQRTDGDEIACFERITPGSVVVFEDFNRPLHFNKRFSSFEDWVRSAIEDMLIFEDEGCVWIPPEKRVRS